MNGKNINFDDKKIEKTEFYKNKRKYNIDDIDVNKILVSKKERYSRNSSLIYFIGCNDNDVIRPLCLRPSKTTGYINEFNENKNTIIISLRVNYEQLFKKYSKIWKKVQKLMRTDFESKLLTYGYDIYIYIYTYIYIYIYIKYVVVIITNFHNKKMPKKKYHVNVYQ